MRDSAGSARATAAALRSGRLTAVECVAAALARLEALEPRIGSVAAVDPRRSLADAAVADARLRAGAGRLLEGVPITVKDWIDVEGWPVTGSIPEHRDRRPERDATAVARLRAAGAVVVAVSRALADSPVHGPTRNPHDSSRAPGGSSSGAAALVAAGATALALASDSGGSIRLPAAWYGVAGLKPTFGRVPLTGHFPASASSWTAARSSARSRRRPTTSRSPCGCSAGPTAWTPVSPRFRSATPVRSR
jgi:Asp-tRNA(Asn)/Glu-tRNA(Gln) amidotransferase A subunit family amidase